MKNIRTAALGLPAIVAVMVVAVACSIGTPVASSGPSLPPADAAGFAAATCTAIDELLLAWGNPDTAEKSDAWKSFESAIERRDTALLDSASAEILTHLAAARVATSLGATWTPGAAANAEMDAVLVGLETQVTTVRAARGDPAIAIQAAETMQSMNWPRLLVYFEKLRELVETNAVQFPNLPCKPSA